MHPKWSSEELIRTLGLECHVVPDLKGRDVTSFQGRLLGLSGVRDSMTWYDVICHVSARHSSEGRRMGFAPKRFKWGRQVSTPDWFSQAVAPFPEPLPSLRLLMATVETLPPPPINTTMGGERVIVTLLDQPFTRKFLHRRGISTVSRPDLVSQSFFLANF